MEEFFQIIEERIRQAGYTGQVSGSKLYDEISDEIDGKENGSYILLFKPEDDTIFEIKVDVLTDTFNLSYIRITDHTGVYQADYDD